MNYFDLHCDTVTEAFKNKESLIDSNTAINFQKASFLRKWIQVFAVFIQDVHCKTNTGFSFFNSQVEFLIKEIEKNSDCLLVKENIDLSSEKSNIFILAMESATGLDGNIDNFYKALALGVKIITLVWNGENCVGYGIDSKKGIKTFGKELISHMERNNVIVDISHAGDFLFDDILAFSKKPIIASHSNSRVLCDNNRNLKDEQILEIKRRKGLIGINFYKEFLADKVSAFNGIYLNICHLLELNCEDIICFGSDYDGCNISSDLNSIEKIKGLYDFLVERGIGKQLLDKIFYLNAYNFFKKNL